MKKFLVVIIFLLSIQQSIVVQAEQSLQDPLYNLTKIRHAALDQTLIEKVEMSGGTTLVAVGLIENKMLWEKIYDDIYDVQVLNTPYKIVLIVNEKNNVKKVVLSSNGTILSEKAFSEIKLPKRDGIHNRIKWFPAKKGEPEQIAVLNTTQSQSELMIYKYPWKVPFLKKKIDIRDQKYEYTAVAEWEYNHPMLLVKYVGGGLMRSDYYLKAINLSTHLENTLKLDQNYEMHLNSSNAILTSKNEIYGLGVCPDSCYAANTDLPIFEIIDLETATVKIIEDKKLSETVEKNAWFTDKSGNYIYTEDLDDHSWHIYSLKGAQLKSGIHDRFIGRFVYYDTRNRDAYFLNIDENGKYIVSKS